MDFALRCNSLKCRTQLADQAVVTTCSHIFCLPCADALGMSKSNNATRTCPACGTHLVNQDDAAVTNLSPTEDYKTSVLSGLNPTTIIECASRAMAFWTYQTTQEVFYQEFLMKSMTEKYHSLSGQMDKLITNANSEVTSLREKISTMQIDNKDLEGKNQQLAEAYKKKCKDNGQLHKLYQQAKQRQVTEMMAEAAEQDVTHMAQQLGRDLGTESGLNAQGSGGRNRSDSSGDGLRFGAVPNANPRIHGFRTSHPTTQASANRTHLTQQNSVSSFLYGDQHASHRLGGHRQPTPLRQPLGNLSANSYTHTPVENFGLGTGMKFGRPPPQSPFFPTRSNAGSLYGGR